MMLQVAAWGPDGARILTASSDKTARAWEAATARELARLEGHGDRVLQEAQAQGLTRLTSPAQCKMCTSQGSGLFLRQF